MNINQNEMDALKMLTEALEKMKQPALPVSVDLWDTAHLAAYFKRSVSRVRSDIVCLPTFPKPIRLPIPGRSQALYKAREVIAWAEGHTSK